MGSVYIIIPPPITDDIRRALFEKTKTEHWPTACDFFNTHVEHNKDKFEVRPEINDATLRRALSSGRAEHTWGVNKKSQWILDALCDIRKSGMTWQQTLEEFGIKEADVQTRISGEPKLSANAPEIKPPVYSNLQRLLSVLSYERITPKTFAQEKTKNKQQLTNLRIGFYLKFDNTSLKVRRIVANNEHVQTATCLPFNVNGETQQYEITSLLNDADNYQPVLITLLGIGGVGKTTLLWAMARDLCKSYQVFYFNCVDAIALANLLEGGEIKTSQPIVILLDDIAKRQSDCEQLFAFGETIERHSKRFKISLILSDRYHRYKNISRIFDFEKSFTYRHELLYSNNEIRSAVFKNVFLAMQESIPELPVEIESECEEIFLNTNSDSIIDLTFSVLRQVTNRYKAINYRFDWDDWNEICRATNSSYIGLYKLVAFFYQFGIGIPLALTEFYFGTLEDKENIRRLLYAPQGRRVLPILLVTDEDDEYLILRNEKIGEWFFEVLDNGIENGRSFFSDFLQRITNAPAAKIFRCICRGNTEFALSSYADLMSRPLALEIIDNYLNKQAYRKFGDDELKMLMEKHFLLLNTGEQKVAIQTLYAALKVKRDNVFMLTRLAFCLRDTDTKKAERLYIKTLTIEQNNYWALTGLWKLYYDHNFHKRFLDVQQKIAILAQQDISFCGKVLSFINVSFSHLKNETIDFLYDVNEWYPSYSIFIFRILAKNAGTYEAKAFFYSQNLLRLHEHQKIDFLSVLVGIYEQNPPKKARELRAVKRIISQHLQENPTSPKMLLVSTRMLCISGITKENYKIIENNFTVAMRQASTSQVLRGFARVFKFAVESLSLNNLPKAVTLSFKFIRILELESKKHISGKHILSLELCSLYSKLSHYLKLHSLAIKNGKAKYRPTILQYEETCQMLLFENLTAIESKLIRIRKSDLFTKHSFNYEVLKYYVKAASVSLQFYRSKRFTSRLDPTTNLRDYETFLLKIKHLLETVLVVDDSLPIASTDLLVTKILLKDNDIESFLCTINFVKYSISNKVYLIEFLMKGRYASLAKNLLEKFGFFNSNDHITKTKLVRIYMNYEFWEFAVKVFKDVRAKTEKNLNTWRLLGFELPLISKDIALSQIQFLKLLNSFSPEASRESIIKICCLLFQIGKQDKSYLFFESNYGLIAPNKDESSCKDDYLSLSERWCVLF